MPKTRPVTEKLARELFDLFNKHNVTSGAAMVTDNSEWTTVPFGKTHRGPKGYTEFGKGWIDAFPDIKCTILRVIADDEAAAVEFRAIGTHRGILMTPGGKLEPTNKKVDILGTQVYEFKQEQVSAGRTFFDWATMARQLGCKV